MRYEYLLLPLLFIGCSKKEDAPKPSTPHVGGLWAGSGTDDAVGYYNISLTLNQTESSASGSFTLVSSLGSQSGDVMIQVGPSGGENVTSMTLTRTHWDVTIPAPSRTCAGTMTLSRPTYMNTSTMQFPYTVTDCQGGSWSGGFTVHKTVGTN